MNLEVVEPVAPEAPINTRRIVIFDTNAYRTIAGRQAAPQMRLKGQRLRVSERSNGNLPLAQPVVIWELLSHLADPTDEHFAACLASVVVLGEHCRDETSCTISQFADAQLTVCRELFGIVPALELERMHQLQQHADHICRNAPEISNPQIDMNLKVFAGEMQRREREWTVSMQEIMSDLDPRLAGDWLSKLDASNARRQIIQFFGSDSFMDAWATVTVLTHATLAGVTLSPSELVDKAHEVRRVFPVPFKLLSSLMQKFVANPDINPSSPKKKWWNFIWDFSICFCIGPEHAVSSASVRLVTSDAAVVAAARSADCPLGTVVALADHLHDIGFT